MTKKMMFLGMFFVLLVQTSYAQDFMPVETNAPNSVPSSLSDSISIINFLKYTYLGKSVPVYMGANKPIKGMVSNIQFRDGRYYATIWNSKRAILDSRINFVQAPGLPERMVFLGADQRNRTLRQNIEVVSFVNKTAVGNDGSAFSSTQQAMQDAPDIPTRESIKRTLEDDIAYFSVKEDQEKQSFFWVAKGRLFVGDGYRVRVRFEEVNG